MKIPNPITIQRKFEIHFGGMDYCRVFGMLILWGWNGDDVRLDNRGCWRQWLHYCSITIDFEAWHNLVKSFKRCLPRISHG
jgi:hypothetical protein